MESDALVTLLTWDRLVPWKILSLPKRVTDDFFPVAYGSRNKVFRGRAKEGSTLWVVTRPEPRGLHPPSLVARITIKGLYTTENLPPHLRSKGVEELLDKWCWVAVSNPEQSEFFELNDASSALRTLQVKSFRVMRSFPGDTRRVNRAFGPCMRRARNRTVFLSHTHAESAEFALALAGALREDGFSPWLDSLTLPLYEVDRKGGPAPERLSKLIRIGLRHSRLAIVIGTKNYGNTVWTRKERDWIHVQRRKGSELRCVEIVRGTSKLRSCDRRFDEECPRAVARKIADWWRKIGAL
ncbi:MAG: TIR domain-containing protein [bacterium]|nr:TIR domain-containing protein [bacterium]